VESLDGKIRHFVNIAELKSLSKAADSLDLTHPGLSRQLAVLELDGNFALARAQLALLLALAQNTGLVEPSAERTQEALLEAEMAFAADAGSSQVLRYAGCALSDLGHTERGQKSCGRL
jgi:DNA-binding transcriptional LysR family regulator